jgi:hypothetical protein
MAATAGKRLVDNLKFVWGTAPANYTGAASESDIVSFKLYGHYTVVIQTGAWAGGTAAVTLKQGTSVSAATTALAFTKMYTNDGATSTDTLTETAVTSNTFNLDTANALYVIEVDEDDLDVNNGFHTLKVAVASPGSNNDLYGVLLIGSKPKFSGDVATIPSAIT